MEENKLIQESPESKEKKNRGWLRAKEIWRLFRKNKAAVVGLIIITIIVFVALFADQIADPELVTKTNAKERKLAPCAEHIFGTDQLGRDMFARVVHAAPTSLTIGVVVAVASLLIGGAIGVACAYYGGLFDSIVMRIVDVLSSVPGTLLSMVVVCVLGGGMKNLIIAMIVGRFRAVVRVSRSAALSVCGREYVEAARAGGSKHGRIMLRHIVPNIMGTLIVSTTMGVSASIISACALSFMGLGVQPPTPEWGYMLNDARAYMSTCPHLMLIPGLAIVITSLSINMMGDGLRDALDPRLKT